MNVINSIKAVIILQIDGRRAIAKYYDDQLQSTCKQFERRLFSRTKTTKPKDEVLVMDSLLVVHKFITDSHIYVVGGRNENPMVLEGVLSCLVEIINSLQTSSTSGNVVLENLSRVILALDEICDSGMILEIDPNLVIQRITATNHDDFDLSMAQRTARRIFGL